MQSKHTSQRFTPTRLTKYLVPALLVLLLGILFAVLLLVVLSLLGFTPGA